MALLSLWEDRNEKRRHNCLKRCYPFSDLLADLQDELIHELRDLPCVFSEDASRKKTKLRNYEGLLVELEETKHYEPEDLTIKLKGRQVEISGKHEEKSKEGERYVYREFRRSFLLPKNADPESVTSELSADGLLWIKASPLCKEKCIKITVEKDDSDKSKCERKENANNPD